MKHCKIGLVAIGALGAALAISPGTADAKVILKEKVTYYNVKGKNGQEIFQNMVKRGPKIGRNNNQHALATTEYEYDIENVDVEIKNGRCVPTDLDVIVKVKYTYPRWRGHKSAKSTTRNAWKKFSNVVEWHEKQHVKIAMEFAEDYEKVLRNTKLRVRDNCEKAPFLTQWRATRAALKNNRKQRKFDRKDLKPGGRGYEAQLQLFKAK